MWMMVGVFVCLGKGKVKNLSFSAQKTRKKHLNYEKNNHFLQLSAMMKFK